MKIKICRSCKSKKLSKVFSLGKQTLTGIFPPSKNAKITKGNLSLILCNQCKLLQLENNFNPNEMYGENYGYMSSLNKSMMTHLKLKALNLLVSNQKGWESLIVKNLRRVLGLIILLKNIILN